MSGNAGDVSEETVQTWMERLEVLIEGYAPQNIWNMDETACFYCALPEQSLADIRRQCRGGKKAKNRLTLA